MFLNKINHHLNDKTGLLYPDKAPKEFYKELYYKIETYRFSTTDFNIPDYDRATMYAFLLTSAFNSCSYMAAGYSGFNKDRLKLLTFINKLNNEYVTKKLEKITHVENMDFETLIKKYDSKDTYFYLNPPYYSEDERRSGWYSSKDSFNKDAHERLAENLTKY